MPRAGWNSLPRPARINGRTAAGFRVGRPALRPPPFIAGAFVCRAAGCGHPALRMSAANRSVGDGVPDVPSARRCRAGNGSPRRFAPRSKCPWGTPRNDRGRGFIDTLPPSDRMVLLFLQCPEKLRLQVAPPLQRRGDLPQQGVPVAVEGALQRQVVAGVVGAEHRALAVHMLQK